MLKLLSRYSPDNFINKAFIINKKQLKYTWGKKVKIIYNFEGKKIEKEKKFY